MRPFRIGFDIVLLASFFFFPWVFSAILASVGLVVFAGYWEFLVAFALGELLFQRNEMPLFMPLAVVVVFIAAEWLRAFLSERVYYA